VVLSGDSIGANIIGHLMAAHNGTGLPVGKAIVGKHNLLKDDIRGFSTQQQLKARRSLQMLRSLISKIITTI